MGKRIDIDDLTDARGVAEILGLSNATAIPTYQRRYPDMPRPILDLGPGRPKLWHRPDVERWQTKRRST